MSHGAEETLLVVSRLESGYGRLQVLWNVSITVSKGELVALLGPNGAGKTTTLRTIAGLIKPKSGTVTYRGVEIAGRPAHEVSRLGIRFIPEHLRLFAGMSVEENLLLGAYTVRDSRQVWKNLERIFDLFPQLADKQKQRAGTLSGGEQRMLAVGRGLMAHPDLLLVDEPSLGLAPKTALAVLSTLHRLKEQGVTILLVEQNVDSTLEMSDRAYVLDHGRVILEGPSPELIGDERIAATYLGGNRPGSA
jgi:branched-chain amino acid transport system ATP-binding protein